MPNCGTQWSSKLTDTMFFFLYYLFHHLFLLTIAPVKYSRLHTVSSQSRYMLVFAVRSALVCPCSGVCKRTSVLSSSSLTWSFHNVLLVVLAWFMRWEVFAILLLFLGNSLQGFVLKNMQQPCKAFSPGVSLMVQP